MPVNVQDQLIVKHAQRVAHVSIVIAEEAPVVYVVVAKQEALHQLGEKIGCHGLLQLLRVVTS